MGKLKTALSMLAVLPLMAGTCGGDEDDENFYYSYVGDDGPQPTFSLQFHLEPFAEPYENQQRPQGPSWLELSERDALLTASGETQVVSNSSVRFRIPLTFEFADMAYPLCFEDDIVVHSDRGVWVVAPGGSICMNEPEDADLHVWLPVVPGDEE